MLPSLRAYRSKVKRSDKTRQECVVLLEKGQTAKARRKGHFVNSQKGIVVGNLVSSPWVKNLPLSRPDLLRRDYATFNDDYEGGALGVGNHPAVGNAVVAVYPSPSARDKLRFASLTSPSTSSSSSSSSKSIRCLQSLDVETPKCDATQISISSHCHRALALGHNFIHLIDFSSIDEGRSKLEIISSLNSEDQNFRTRFQSSAFNPWIESEVVVSSKDGDVRLWDLDADDDDDDASGRSLQKLFVGEVRFPDPFARQTSQVLFGSHPRLILHGNETGVSIWDVRRRGNYTSADLFGLPHSSLGTEERVCRVLKSKLDSHLFFAITNRSLISLDERMPNVPVGNFKHGLRRRPQYATSTLTSGEGERVFLGTQMPWEVNVVSVSKQGPSMPIRLGDSAQNCPKPEDSRRFFSALEKRSLDLIGIAALDNGDSVDDRLWQLSSRGDLFMTDLSETSGNQRDRLRNEFLERRLEFAPRSNETSDLSLSKKDVRNAWRVLLTTKSATEGDNTNICILCRTKRSEDRRVKNFFDQSDEEGEEDSRSCVSCGVDKTFAASAKEAHLSNGVIAHHVEGVDVDELFDRMTLKEHYESENKVFTLNKDNLDAFLRASKENNDSRSAESQEENASSLGDGFSSLDSDLLACLSQRSLSFLDRKVPSEASSTPDRVRQKRSITSESAGFSLTPKRLKRKTTRCLWNPFFMQHTLFDVREPAVREESDVNDEQ